ncbi:MAG: hemerythrin domain-containing protein, partial [Candidatus Electrothrix sp. EH2]|nr:hemerythrin domain-containing protein [Candidatus Electrothrix sp. EH2]
MDKNRMDKLTREAHEHEQILESMVFFEKFLKIITSDNAENYIPQLQRFADEYIVQHFKFEEQELFPVLLQKGSSEEQEFIRELRSDHEQILCSLAEFKDFISLYEPRPNKEQVKKIIKSSEAVISQIILRNFSKKTIDSKICSCSWASLVSLSI